MHSSIIIFACFIYSKSLSVLSLRLLEPPLVIVEQSHVFNLRAAEKDLFLLRWLQDLPAKVCRSGQLAISYNFIMLCWGNYWNFFMLSTMSSSSICCKKSHHHGDLLLEWLTPFLSPLFLLYSILVSVQLLFKRTYRRVVPIEFEAWGLPVG